MFGFDDEKWAQLENQLTLIHNTEVAAYDFLKEFEGLAMPNKIYGSPILPEIARALGKIQACSLKKEATDPVLHKNAK
ncbi:hypothetical protein PRIPAC_77265 [Pristionchus pacificus]|uniref:Uncharacterized protein n=1 Tax=Pristionchus pacificus TaxID=54126 RepID=A0A2A6C3X3_PRIPA|nr:hypothetical protein PRIPAC_77265 [Pristionchus pacificus]|eukprot:PDM72807.1 hypothetical protein PRIPAC_39241 [Pristionchus pacificus]